MYLNDVKARADYAVSTPYAKAFTGHANVPTGTDDDVIEDVNHNGRIRRHRPALLGTIKNNVTKII
ncbi:hypothetical protein Mtc_1684 [Methanocella conradii HZ254]|uniref:Uncharacterized protein n=1 Tax=Methanocella conradii (strain DSM 24694 / JCM 17849 / CGMCC 1.5162 / HZ254) TaxID=1041930 RepID=H8I8V9_METCZ|nr:hypothetical protein [Methanocella conradii]AFD00430.1 hypothetical protein Mtc_1684 [Methanocella conradii HZ254]